MESSVKIKQVPLLLTVIEKDLLKKKMSTKSKAEIKKMIAKDLTDIYCRADQVKKSIKDDLKDVLDFFDDLISQISLSTSGPLLPKTPKTTRKKAVQRIETIPENDMFETNNTKVERKETEIVTVGRLKREASKKAASNIKRQQSLTRTEKLRRPSSGEGIPTKQTVKRASRAKRKKSASSDEETVKIPMKYSKIEESIERESITITGKRKYNDRGNDSVSTEENVNVNVHVNVKSKENSNDATMTVRRSVRNRSSARKDNIERQRKESIRIIGNDTVLGPTTNEFEEPSMYEDAISEKPTPIMNSTMVINSTFTLQRMMNATVVLEPMQLNETVTIVKKFSEANSLQGSKPHSEKPLNDRMDQLKEAMANKEFDNLLTDDESSPEIKKRRPALSKKREEKKSKTRIRSESSVSVSESESESESESSDEQVLSTPMKLSLREKTKKSKPSSHHEMRNTYKSNALFSPYAKESVKKRVEAFEQAGVNSPVPSIQVDAPTRVTRTKTRAIAAAQAENLKTPQNNSEKTAIGQKLARKSLAKAKKILLAKQGNCEDEYKENTVRTAQKVGQMFTTEKINQKQQLKTTPLGRQKTQLPMSVNRVPNTPSTTQPINNFSKALSATRNNIIVSVDSFVQNHKSTSKVNFGEEKKRRNVVNDEDVRKKKEEALRILTEEKRRKRQEKELRNKLAREAKEKLDMEKRQKAEKEREEKARLAQQVQEKQREEAEKKRLAQLQRAQETEERRKQEEQLRVQRLQEQEEAERLLAEQRRREQEAEKRREAEARAQQQAALDAQRMKAQVLAAQGKQANDKQNSPKNYILDSEPDEDESDDESKPKHVIPHWALPHVRKAQLAMQRGIPDKALFKFFGTRKCTPDLTELFHGIDRKRLKRTSSAIWKTAPRYSMMELYE